MRTRKEKIFKQSITNIQNQTLYVVILLALVLHSGIVTHSLWSMRGYGPLMFESKSNTLIRILRIRIKQ